GEISEIFVAGQNMLVMKCLEREDSGYVPLEGVRGVFESQIRTESTRYMRENPGMPIQGALFSYPKLHNHPPPPSTRRRPPGFTLSSYQERRYHNAKL
ncbi:hypothetical protein NE639_26800, partial [Blautia producta]|nr:hypothetical protein [Blautia producta]